MLNLFIHSREQERESMEVKSCTIPDVISERESSRSSWSSIQNKLDINWHAWSAGRICINCWIISKKKKTLSRLLVSFLGNFCFEPSYPFLLFPFNWTYNCCTYSVNPHRSFLDFWYILYFRNMKFFNVFPRIYLVYFKISGCYQSLNIWNFLHGFFFFFWWVL